MAERDNPLDSSPFRDDDLREELAVQPRKGPSRLTLALGAGVVLVAGVLIGIQAHKTLDGQAAPAAAAGGRQSGDGYQGYGRRMGGMPGNGTPPGYGGQPGDGQPGGQPGQRAGGFGGGTVGTVEKVEDGKVYLKAMDGSTVTVTTTGSTTVQISKPGKVADLATGSTVVVRGQKAADGSVAAVSISQGGGAR
ncbi:hypothetical protein GCM10010149_49390 [Nonomuraea roseoviolacea subsp. roseoviolacea]|uniref:DUF5666 domain-containing protein n=1 Tax=Nonomuraea roseoviolacea subsp. carminata TaxID=160689 RepID=A0ABT1KGH7_9ACTN|nr:hypothetical protein [Nonomuraea roseoviolacea]MCP2352764.1 hypothetical protein [Nonomuraea roseoviolacea subsp. carminata]